MTRPDHRITARAAQEEDLGPAEGIIIALLMVIPFWTLVACICSR
ncbi:MAG TPA: hypothetical protein VIZ17_04350 [Acetobacteraceae bacterium]